jgi:hypothetical protein
MSEKIRDLISVNRQAALIRGVQLDWYGDPQQERENERLASGYIFSSGATSHGSLSAINIFTRIRETLNISGAHNIFTVIAQYGHGKSHFALVLANYFGRVAGDPVLTKIIRQIESCTDANTAHLFEAFKNQAQKPQLVIRLSGHDFRDLRQGFMKALRRALDENEHSRGYSIGAITTNAAKWLRSLTGERQRQAQGFLDEHHQTDLDALINALDNFDSTKETIARDLSLRLNGVPADFGADLNLREVINQVIADLCVGADGPYHKMVILFDELGIYAEKWCANRMAAGDLAPQQLLEACDNNKGKICLVAFIQREIGEAVKSYEVQDDFRKWAERFPPETRFWLESSLEQVIQGLLTKNRPVWNEFALDHMPRIDKEAEAAWRILPYYQNKPEQWTQNKFISTVGVGAFPLHPLTTGLLCNLTFTQGARTIIEVVNTAVENKADDAAVLPSGKLNLVLPTFLVEEFAVNFDQQEDRYNLYTHAREKLGANAPSKLYEILKALFLFEVGGLKRFENQSHASVLAHLCGVPEDDVADALKELDEEYGVIRFAPARREYEFSGIGTSKNEIREQIKRQISGQRVASLATKLEGLNMLEGVKLEDSEAVKYKSDHGLEGEDWRLKPRLLDVSKLNPETVKRVTEEGQASSEARGTVIYVVSSDSAELEEAQEQATRILDKLRIGDNPYPTVLAIPSSPAVGIEQEILIYEVLVNWNQGQKERFGEAYGDAIKDCKRRLKESFEAHLRHESLRYYTASIVAQRLKNNETHHLDLIASKLFEESFPYRVPARSHFMRMSSTRGNSIVADVARRLLVNDIDFGELATESKNLISHVLVDGPDKWGVLTARHRLQEPTDSRVKEAWKVLDGAVLEDRPVTFAHLNARLQSIPYGHDDYTLTLLYASWVGIHKNELRFHGSIAGSNTQRPLSISEFRDQLRKAKDFIKWLNERTITIQRPGRITKRRATDYLRNVEGVSDFEKAKKLLDKLDEILADLATDDDLRANIVERAQKLQAEVTNVAGHIKEIQSFRSGAEKTDSVMTLLRIVKNFPKKPQTQLQYDESVYSDALHFIENKIESEVNKQTLQPLGRIENHESLRNKIKEIGTALRQSGRQDLEKLCVTALERVEEEYKALKVLAEIEGFKPNDANLAANRKQATYIEELLASKLTQAADSTRQRIERHLQGMNKRIASLADWINSLPQRVERAANLENITQQRDDLIARERDYEQTPEAELLLEQRHALEGKERKLRDEANRQAARQAQVTAFMQVVQTRLGRIVKAQSFATAVVDMSDLSEVVATPENSVLNEAERAEVDNAIEKAKGRVETLLRELLRPRDLQDETEYINRQAELERAASSIQSISNVSNEWHRELEASQQQFNQVFADWRAKRSRDIANRIIDDFGRLQTPEQRANCLLKIAEICKAEGLSAEYLDRLVEVLELRESV